MAVKEEEAPSTVGGGGVDFEERGALGETLGAEAGGQFGFGFQFGEQLLCVRQFNVGNLLFPI